MSQSNIIRDKDRKFAFIILSITIIALIIDTSIVKVYRLITPPLSLEWDITTFIVIVIVYSVVQYILLRQVKTQVKSSRLFSLNLIHKIVFLV